MTKYFHAWNCVFMGLPKPFWQLLKHCGDLQYGWENFTENDLVRFRIGPDYIRNFKQFKQTGEPFKQFESFRSEGIKVITCRSKFYPSHIKNVIEHYYPLVLYIKGDLPTVQKYYLAVVGTRDMTEYGQTATRRIVANLNRDDFVVVSGLARGVDTTAHKTALENGISTVAVLGFGLNRIPHYLKTITEQIVKTGALVSEYPPNLAGQKWHFPLRNRIISGLSKTVLVVEAGDKSGASITAGCALDQNLEVMAVPGNIFSEKSIGTNRLIKKGAIPICSPDDIYEHIDIEKNVDKAALGQNLSLESRLIVENLQKHSLNKTDLIRHILIPVAKLSACLTELELANLIERNKAGKYFIK